jgi:hypothetical protein
MTQRLLGEERVLRKKMEDHNCAVGDALPVTWDMQYAADAGIGRYGRMTYDEGEFLYHVAPKDIDRKPRYELDSANSMSSVNRWLNGQRIDVPIGKQTEPIKTITSSVDWDVGVYEEQLFDKIMEKGALTLINPSFKSMSSAVRVEEGPYHPVRVFLTSNNPKTRQEKDQEYSWRRSVEDFCRQSKGRVAMVYDREKVKGTSYLGESNPIEKPWSKWVRFIPSPYSLNRRPSFQETEYGLDMVREVVKDDKKRLLCCSLSRECEFVYNPETVDKWLRQASVKYFVESNFFLEMRQVPSTHLFMAPRYLRIPADVKQEKMEDGRVVRRDGSFVYDIEGPMTYYSKRSLNADLPWAPFEDHGTHCVTYSSIAPLKLDMEVYSGVLHFADQQVEAVYLREEVTAEPGCIFVRTETGEDYESCPRQEGVIGRDVVRKVWSLSTQREYLLDWSKVADFPGFYLQHDGRIRSGVTVCTKRGNVMAIPEKDVAIVYPSLESVFRYSARSSPWKSLTKLRGPLPKVMGGTVSVSGAEVDFFEKFGPVTGIGTPGVTPHDIVRGTPKTLSRAMDQLCSAPGVILWSLKPAQFQLLQKIDIPLKGWVNRDKSYTFCSFREMWGALERGARSFSFPLGFDASIIVRILGYNGCFPKRVHDLEAYTYHINWIKATKYEGNRREYMVGEEVEG